MPIYEYNGTKPAAKKGEPAESSNKESSKTDATCGAGACPACSSGSS